MILTVPAEDTGLKALTIQMVHRMTDSEMTVVRLQDLTALLEEANAAGVVAGTTAVEKEAMITVVVVKATADDPVLVSMVFCYFVLLQSPSLAPSCSERPHI